MTGGVPRPSDASTASELLICAHLNPEMKPNACAQALVRVMTGEVSGPSDASAASEDDDDDSELDWPPLQHWGLAPYAPAPQSMHHA